MGGFVELPSWRIFEFPRERITVWAILFVRLERYELARLLFVGFYVLLTRL